ncbi:MAG: valine--tRNA ligase [Candidatus Woesebacteria bacterium]|nr:valine--tRNA ligase [Candidatus Woesebacteria bacterium]
MDTKYDHKLYEDKIYKEWEQSGAFSPVVDKKKKPFTIIMPPPNASDPLHIGHAREVSTQDILIRFHRMTGDPTLWLPGADHAGIETQFIFEKKLREKGKSRFDFDRETLYQMIWDDVQKNKGTMESQLRRLGASCDWSRNKFTLDPDIVKIVYQTFKNLYDDKLIYRGKRLVNYCTKCGTGYSELEVEHIDQEAKLYYIKYGPFVLATTRPETKFADTALAVHPNDKRYKKYVGQEIEVEGLLGNFKLKVISDTYVDPKFGTGVVKITPYHDFNDFEVWERHKNEMPEPKQVIDKTGRLTEIAGKYAGVKIKAAREIIENDLKEMGLLEKVTQNYLHNVGVCYRCKTILEPIPSEQWYINVKPLTTKALKSIKDEKVKFVAKKYEKIAIHWLKNLKDWNISRQIVWGIRIPAWKNKETGEWVITDGKAPKGAVWEQDTDTFDTWFSSGQWPFATLQTTKKGDFEYFYPTSVMDPSYDILPFWVIRMVMLGLYRTNKVPFANVLLHGLVRDKNGVKISKSKGNVIDPIDMADKYGADALRIALVRGVQVESDNSLSEENIKGQRNFSNKIWNAGRFVKDFDNRVDDNKEFNDYYQKEFPKKITLLLEKYKIGLAAEELYNTFWHKFCDIEIERAKKDEISSKQLKEALMVLLKLLHPFMPFITEALWHELGNKDLLLTSKWPSISNV